MQKTAINIWCIFNSNLNFGYTFVKLQYNNTPINIKTTINIQEITTKKQKHYKPI